MNCERSRELFADYLGEESTRDDAQQFQLHLKACAGCRQELALLGGTKATLQRAPPEVAMPQHLSFNFSRAQPQGWRQWLRQPRYATLAAMTAGFVICVASLAMFGAQLKWGSDGFQISLGRPSATPAAPAPVAQRVSVTSPGKESKEEVQRLTEARLAEFEQTQTDRFERQLTAAKNQWQTQRRQDWQQVSAGLRYLEANQRSMVQDSVRNATFIQSLANNIYAKAETPTSLR